MTISKQKKIENEHIQWRKKIPLNYNLVIHHELDWPALSVQWINKYEYYDSEAMKQQILISIHTSEQEMPYFAIVDIMFPSGTDNIDNVSNATLSKRIYVNEEVNRAKCNPKKKNLVATRSDDKTVKLYDTLKIEKKGEAAVIFNGHSKGGYGIDWCNFNENLLITCGEDDTVCLFDTNNLNAMKTEGDAIKIFTHHTAVVNDICFSKREENIFASVGDDKKIGIQDIRNPKGNVYSAHESDILSVEWNFFDENLLCTGSADTTVKIWDRRKMNDCLHSCNFHSGSINQVRWSPHMENVLASCSKDRKIAIWDFKENSGKSPIFVHGGHKDNVNDISWNPFEMWEIASVCDDNSFQIWSKKD